MQVMIENKIVPKLRFGEFIEDWDMRYGNEIFKIISNKNHNSDLPILAISQKFGAIPREMIDYRITVTSNSVSSYKVVDVGDFIISLRSFQGGIEYSNYKGICSPAYNILRPFVEVEDSFYRYYLKTYKYIIKLQSKLEGIREGKMISYKYFSEIKLPFPTLSEQKKIASFLSAVDEKLQQLNKKKDLLEEYKKGVIQKIFSQELRFKDDNGNNYPHWEEKKLGEFSVNYHQGINTASDRVVYQQNGYPILQAKHITDEVIDFTDARFLSKLDYDNYSTKYKPKLNDILISNIGTIGKIVQVEEDLEYLVAWNIFKVTLNHKLCYPKFILYVLRDVSRRGYFERVKTGNATKFVNKGDMLSIKVSFPSLDEQQKIASFFSSLDSKIDLVSTQIENTKAFKKGLLQQMFV
jgi:type I restriction enzyme, S subunit